MLKIFWLFSNTKIDFSNNFPKSYKNVLYIKFYFNRMLLTSTIYFVMKFCIECLNFELVLLLFCNFPRAKIRAESITAPSL